MPHELLLEIGTEEIPAGFIADALRQMADIATRLLKDKRLPFDLVKTAGTPRRLTLVVSGLAERQEDVVNEIVGPPKRVAYDQAGNPTNAALGFAKSQGVDISAVATVETPKGEYLVIRKEQSGEDTATVLQTLLPELCQAISFPKSMRWGTETVAFARPVHWILGIYGGKTVPFAFGSITSGNVTYGHRFMAPGPIEVQGFAAYQDALRGAWVIVDPEERKAKVRAEVTQAAAEVGGRVLDDEPLLDTVTNLVEYPSAVCGRFSPEYLALPQAVLITSMREHQKYFAVIDDQGKLMSHFVAVNNTPVTDPSIVARGHERVLRARLEDARFFFEEDRKKPLSAFTEGLKGVIFHSRLGTSYEKVMRVKDLAVHIAVSLNSDKVEDVERAAYLCKADLLTSMVREFPTLQGTMGREYALLGGEMADVADAILEHYRPAFAGDALPETLTGCILSIADKMDTIAGCFGIGLTPSGTADPYALRRQALAVLNIIMRRSLDLSLKESIARSCALLAGRISGDVDRIAADILSFFKTRYQYLLNTTTDADVIDAVTSLYFDSIRETQGRIEALQEFKSQPEFAALSTSFKRVVNISKDARETDVAPDLFANPAEHRLYEMYRQTDEKVQREIERRDYLAALRLIAGLKTAIDEFFDAVMVMDKDEKLRRNRLNLLCAITELFKTIADFGRLQTPA